MRVFIVLFSFCMVVTGQTIEGSIVDAKSGEPVMNATVYLDGTSVGTVSDIDGKFSFAKPEEINADLIISIISYEKKRINDPVNTNLNPIRLVKKTNVLDEVVLQLDPWSRKKKERYFKEQFLGSVPEASKCDIVNLDKVRLRFNPSTELLTAVCDEPIVILNKHLGYKIYYDLSDFEIQFVSYQKQTEDLTRRNVKSELAYGMKGTFFLGSSYFQELEGEKPSLKRRIKRREKAYLLSDLRFYRSLANNKLQEEGYTLYRHRKRVPISDNLRVNKINDFSRVNFRFKQYDFLINGKHQSFFVANGETIIDSFGNNLTGKSITFGGYISLIKLSGLLPLDYGL